MDITEYYFAAHLRHLVSWAMFWSQNCWTEPEYIWLVLIYPNSLPCSSGYTISDSDFLAPMQFTKLIWWQTKDKFNLTSTKSLLTSFFCTLGVPDSSQSKIIQPWRLCSHLDSMLLLFSKLQDKYNLPSSTFYSYVQIQHFAQLFTKYFKFNQLTPPWRRSAGRMIHIFKTMSTFLEHPYMLIGKGRGTRISLEDLANVLSILYNILMCWYYTVLHI